MYIQHDILISFMMLSAESLCVPCWFSIHSAQLVAMLSTVLAYHSLELYTCSDKMKIPALGLPYTVIVQAALTWVGDSIYCSVLKYVLSITAASIPGNCQYMYYKWESLKCQI